METENVQWTTTGNDLGQQCTPAVDSGSCEQPGYISQHFRKDLKFTLWIPRKLTKTHTSTEKNYGFSYI